MSKLMSDLLFPAILKAQEAVAPGDIKIGDVVRAVPWSKPRVVVLREGTDEGYKLTLLDHDPKFAESKHLRVVDQAEAENRTWFRYPNLTKLYNLAYPEPAAKGKLIDLNADEKPATKTKKKG